MTEKIRLSQRLNCTDLGRPLQKHDDISPIHGGTHMFVPGESIGPETVGSTPVTNTCARRLDQEGPGICGVCLTFFACNAINKGYGDIDALPSSRPTKKA